VIRFLVRRLAQAALVVFAVVSLTFFLLRLAPGDPLSASLEHPSVSPEVRARWHAELGLDRPLPVQYVRWVAAAARGDLGVSSVSARPVGVMVREALPNTLLLMGTALLASFVLGIAVGVVQAVLRGTLADRALGMGSLLFYSMPEFWLATVALIAFTYWLPIFPSGGLTTPVVYDYMGPVEKVADRVRHLVLPAATLTLLTSAAIARYQRSAMLDVIHEDWLRTARAKGLAERAVIFRHALRNALLPVITLFGLAFPALLGGAVFVEKVFSWPGMGRVAVDAIGSRDYPLVLACVLVGSLMVAAGNLLADLLYAAVDPRMREAG